MSGMYNTFYDINKSTLWGIKKDSEFTPSFKLAFRDGNPRFSVSTGEKGVMINYPTNYIDMLATLNLIKKIAKSSPGSSASIQAKMPIWKDNAPTKDLKVVSTLTVGKTSEGLVYLKVEEDGKPTPVFCFNRTEFHVFTDGNKEEMSKAEVSALYATGYADLMINVVSNAMSDYTAQNYNQSDFKPVEIENGRPGGDGKPKNTKPVIKELSTVDDYSDDVPF